MTSFELKLFWFDTSEQDYITFKNLFKCGDYNWTLFIGHLVLEKLLKALILQNNPENIIIPKSHDLLLLAKRANLKLNEKDVDLFDMVTTFNINARYPDYKKSFYKKCTFEYTNARVKEIEELRTWLINQIKM